MTLDELKKQIDATCERAAGDTPVYFGVIINHKLRSEIFDINRTYLANRPDGTQYIEILLDELKIDSNKNIGDNRE